MKILYFVSLFYVFPSYSEKLPDLLDKHRCKMDANFKKCYVESANEVISELTKGDPKLGLPSLYPLKMDFRRLINHPVLQLNISDISYHGLYEMRVIDVDLNMDKGVMKLTSQNRNITVLGNYDMDGKLLVFQVTGHGKFDVHFSNATYYLYSTFDKVQKNGEYYMKRNNTHVEIDIESAYLNFENLFNGNKELADIVIKSLNDNWRSFLKDYGRFIEDFVEEIFGIYFDKIFGSFPIKDIFE